MSALLRLFDALIARIPRPAWAALAIVAALLILDVGRTPEKRINRTRWMPTGADKVLHFTAFACLATCVFRAIYPMDPRRGPNGVAPMLAVVLIPSLVGLTDEHFQSFTPGRSSDPMDWLADTLGAVTVATVGLAHRDAARARWREIVAARRRRRARRRLSEGRP